VDSLERLEIARKVRADEALRQPILGDDRSFNASAPESTVGARIVLDQSHDLIVQTKLIENVLFLFYRAYLRSNLGAR